MKPATEMRMAKTSKFFCANRKAQGDMRFAEPRIGRASYPVNSYGLIRFFPSDGQPPYQINLKEDEIEWINN